MTSLATSDRNCRKCRRGSRLWIELLKNVWVRITKFYSVFRGLGGENHPHKLSRYDVTSCFPSAAKFSWINRQSHSCCHDFSAWIRSRCKMSRRLKPAHQYQVTSCVGAQYRNKTASITFVDLLPLTIWRPWVEFPGTCDDKECLQRMFGKRRMVFLMAYVMTGVGLSFVLVRRPSQSGRFVWITTLERSHNPHNWRSQNSPFQLRPNGSKWSNTFNW